MDYPQKDLLDALLALQIHSPLDEKFARKLEYLEKLQSDGILDDQFASAATFDGPLFNDDRENPPSNLAFNSNQTQLASYGTSDFATPNYYQAPTSFASSPFDSSIFTNQNQDQSEQSHPVRNSFAVSSPDAAHDQTQRATSIAAAPGSPQANDSAHADAVAIVPRANTALPPPGLDGLQFASYEAASAANDSMFRAPVMAPARAIGDDVVEVEQRKRLHVKSLVDALKHDGFMPPPEGWKGKDNRMVTQTQENKEDLVAWQERERASVRGWMKMPTIDVKLECMAWEIFEEILKVHRTGAKLSKKSTGSKSKKSSQRVQEAVKTLRDWANVRLKAINFDKIPNFAANPQGYAHATFINRRCNSKRASNKKQEAADLEAAGSDEAGKADETGEGGEAGGTGKAVEAVEKAVKKAGATVATATGRRGASENGAIAHQCMPSVEVRQRKRKAESDAKPKVNGQQQKKAALNANTATTQGLSTSVDNHGRASSGEVHPMMSTPLPAGYSGTSQPKPVQSPYYGIMAPPPSPVNNDYSLGRSLGASTLTPTRMPGLSVSDIASHTNFTFANLTSNNQFSNNNTHNSYGSGQALYGDPTLYVNQALDAT